jgi:hypothetical protein
MKYFGGWMLGLLACLGIACGADARPVSSGQGPQWVALLAPPDPAAPAIQGAMVGAFASGLLATQMYSLFQASLAKQGMSYERFVIWAALGGVPAGATLGLHAWAAEQDYDPPKRQLIAAFVAGLIGDILGYGLGTVIAGPRAGLLFAPIVGGLLAVMGYQKSAGQQR